MRQILNFVFNLFRIPFWVLLTLTVFSIEYLCVKDDERIERSDTSPLVIVCLPVILAFVGYFEAGEIIDKIGISTAYTFIWAWIHRSASLARRHFPDLVTLQILNTLKTVEETLPMVLEGILLAPIILSLTLVYQLLGPQVLKYLWYPLFTKYVPAFYLFLNRPHYNALDPQLSTIRLLQLLPGEPSEPIKCRLVNANVHNAEFEAVSYTWGGHLVLRRQIFIDGKSFWVTQNILLALRALRRINTERTLWIDQMCINQQDINEKADQVTHKMHHVYRNATRVIVWLGSSTPDITWAFEQAKLYSANSHQRPSVFGTNDKQGRDAEQSRYIDAWKAVVDRKWFRRIWIVQEVALARHLVVVCGANEMDWELLKRTILELKQEHKAEISHFPVKLFNLLSRSDGDIRKTSLLDLAIQFNTSEATYAEDKLIGLLALAEDGHHYASIHYRHRPVLVFASFTAAYIQRTRSLAILALAGNIHAPFLAISPCSWAPSWDTNTIRINDPTILWGVEVRPSTINRIAKYCASGDRPAVCRRELGNSTASITRGIFLHGWYVDTVKAVSIVGVSYKLSNTLSIWEEFAQHHIGHCAEFVRVFESVILAEIYNVEQIVSWPQWYVPEYKRRASSSLDGSQPMHRRSEILEALCGQRRMFVTMKGKLGLGPAFTKPGDHVCVFEGGAVPFLVRDGNNIWQTMSAGRLFASNFDYNRPYRLVGQAVVSGIMYASDQEIEDQIQNGLIVRGEILLR